MFPLAMKGFDLLVRHQKKSGFGLEWVYVVRNHKDTVLYRSGCGQEPAVTLQVAAEVVEACIGRNA